MVWIAGAGSLLLLVLVVVGVVDLTRNRHTMETDQVAVWAVILVLLPVVGLVSYLLWRLARSDSMQDAIDFEDEHSAKGEP
jgi:hypothetical protein